MFTPLTARNTNEILKRAQSADQPHVDDSLVGQSIILQRQKRNGQHEERRGVVEFVTAEGVGVVNRKTHRYYEFGTWTIIDAQNH